MRNIPVHVFTWLMVCGLVSLLLTGCSGRNPDSVLQRSDKPATLPDVADTAAGQLPAAMLEEIHSAQPPDGVADATWDKLAAELMRVLASRPPEKLAAAPPTGARNMVGDLHIVDFGGDLTLAWTYCCAGDYNQDSMVTVSDLTPVGIYFNASAGGVNWGKAQAADGDNNGLITVSDITPIGQNYGTATAMYNVYASSDPADYPEDATAPSGPGTRYITSAIFNEQPVGSGGRRLLSALIDAPVPGDYYWIRPSDGTTSGAPINMTGRNLRGDWWMAGREPAHKAQSPFFASRTADVAWEYDAGTDICSAPAIRDSGGGDDDIVVMQCSLVE